MRPMRPCPDGIGWPTTSPGLLAHLNLQNGLIKRGMHKHLIRKSVIFDAEKK